ncbi:hypothetical protein B5807_00675 [Epicoccum nigrum]|uniref:Protein HRI1 n=1 Tax=Epicoccum nigrum TaxID=105696 RepID=A0A1Y2MG36_EPING|nr:hypothetical protein B5807_00675 [Epicoccum nigrum]
MSSSTTPTPSDPEPTYTAPSTTTVPAVLTSTPNISVREYIYYLPYPLPPKTPTPYTPGLPAQNPLNLPPHPFEPTSTLVLTSPSLTFVDLRYLNPLSVSQPEPPNPGDLGRLDWGFAGSSFSQAGTGPPHPTLGAFKRASWTHWVDSRVRVGHAPARDDGDMYALGGGRFLEVGFAFHPHLGCVAGHEELWRDVEVKSTETGGEKRCVVLRCGNEARGVRGVVVRVGQFCQGILMVGGEVTTERWEAEVAGGSGGEGKGKGTVEEKPQQAKWKRTARSGTGWLPCSVTWRNDAVVLGGMVTFLGFEWVVEEVWEWV